MHKLHATDIENFLKCRRQFKYRHLDRIKPKNFVRPVYFDFGDHWHKTLKAHYAGENPQPVISQIEDQETQASINSLYKLYVPQYEEEDKRLNLASLEQEFEIEIEGEWLIFTLDILSLTDSKPKKFYEVIDHKAYQTLPDSRYFDFDFQASFYLWGARKVGLNVQRFLLNVTKKSPPTIPTPLKKGGLSKSKSVLDSTEYDLYLEAIIGFGLKPDDYKDELAYLKKRGSSIFKRYPINRTLKELDRFEEKLRYIIREIRDSGTMFYDEPNKFECLKCPYNFLCKVENQGGNVELLKMTDFERKTDDER